MSIPQIKAADNAKRACRCEQLQREQTEAPRKVGAQEQKDSACKPGRSVGDGLTYFHGMGEGAQKRRVGNSSREGGERIFLLPCPSQSGRAGQGQEGSWHAYCISSDRAL